MSSWIIGSGLAVLACAASLLYLWRVRRNRAEMEAGLKALAGLRWREFSALAAQAMQQRGLRDDGRPASERGDATRMLMVDADQTRWLVACKHGLAYRIGVANIEELAAEMHLVGAQRGILLTEGRAERDALAAAESLGIELVDGPRLWPLLRPFLGTTAEQIVGAAQAEAKRHSLIAALGALALGLAVAALLPQLSGTGGNAAAPAPPATAATAAATPPAGATAQAAEAEADQAIVDDPDEATLQRHQADIVRQLSRQPGITRAYWLTRATLVVDRVGADTIVWPLICAELERYPALRTVRVQLNPRPGYEEPVRWRQCRTL